MHGLWLTVLAAAAWFASADPACSSVSSWFAFNENQGTMANDSVTT